ncbi:protein memo1 [Anaeramoeba flamelloides]|uniref:Protein memo1 n=1 Tax=Anaeramoeba flamelloides TaxID=1746091 RepID=A0ABQ8Z3X1_9EUKA|nr:protein memo1 [Anaeramoeba flamelloides]
MIVNCKTRQASHQGTWYPSDPKVLKRKINLELSRIQDAGNSTTTTTTTPISIIVPHAGFEWCSSTSSYSWKLFQEQGVNIKRIFILGPSHFHYTNQCLLTRFTKVSTPFGEISVDVKTVQRLLSTKLFGWIPESVDLQEHSLEMQFPWISHLFDHKKVKVIPILVGDLTTNQMKEYASALKKYIKKDSRNLFVISTDFCHWGERFRYTQLPTSKERKPIWKLIKQLDMMAIEKIQSNNPTELMNYKQKWKNTICGFNSIQLFLSASQKQNLKFKFLHYDQSSRVVNDSDSSVSYVSGIWYFENSLSEEIVDNQMQSNSHLEL